MFLILPSLTASLANQQGWYNWLWIFCLTRLSNIIWVERTNQLVGGMFDLDYIGQQPVWNRPIGQVGLNIFGS
jgi:hypothetical protein